MKNQEYIDYELEKNAEVISQLDEFASKTVDTVLLDPDNCWQPTDFLPDSNSEEFFDEIKDKENNIKFLDSLLLEDKTLEKYFINCKEKLENEIKNINSNIRLMDDILNK